MWIYKDIFTKMFLQRYVLQGFIWIYKDIYKDISIHKMASWHPLHFLDVNNGIRVPQNGSTPGGGGVGVHTHTQA